MKIRNLTILLLGITLLSTSVLAMINTGSVASVGNSFKVGENIYIKGNVYSTTPGLFPSISYTLTTDEGQSFHEKARNSMDIGVNEKISFETPGQHYANLNVEYHVTAYNSKTHRWELVTETAIKTFEFEIEAEPTEPQNIAPIADFDYACNELTCNFFDLSTDTDGQVAESKWFFGDGTVATEKNPEHTYANEGTYEVTLLVTDDKGASDTLKREVTVTSPVTPTPNEAPVAAFTVTNEGNNAYTFTSTSTDTDGTIASYEWKIDDGNVLSTSNTFTYTFTEEGTYAVKLTVTDNEGATDSEAYVITVTTQSNESNNNDNNNNNTQTNEEIGITINAGEVARAYVNEPVEFTGTASDSNGYIVSFAWDFDGDGTYDVEDINPITANHTYTAPGIYTAKFKVIDNEGNTETAERTIIIGEEQGVPKVNAGEDVNTETLKTVYFLGTATDDDGTIVKYEWDFDYNSTEGFTTDYTSTRDGTATHTYYKAGTYTAALRVTDNDGKTATDYLTVTVTGEDVNEEDTSTEKRYDFRFDAVDVKRTSNYNFNDATTTVELTITNLKDEDRTFMIRDIVPKTIATYYDEFQVMPEYDIVYNVDPELGWNMTIGAYESATIKYTFYKFVNASEVENWEKPTLIEQKEETNTTTSNTKTSENETSSTGVTGLVIGAMNAAGISTTALIVIIVLAVVIWKKEYIVEKLRRDEE